MGFVLGGSGGPQRVRSESDVVYTCMYADKAGRDPRICSPAAYFIDMGTWPQSEVTGWRSHGRDFQTFLVHSNNRPKEILASPFY